MPILDVRLCFVVMWQLVVSSFTFMFQLASYEYSRLTVSDRTHCEHGTFYHDCGNSHVADMIDFRYFAKLIKYFCGYFFVLDKRRLVLNEVRGK